MKYWRELGSKYLGNWKIRASEIIETLPANLKRSSKNRPIISQTRSISRCINYGQTKICHHCYCTESHISSNSQWTSPLARIATKRIKGKSWTSSGFAAWTIPFGEQLAVLCLLRISSTKSFLDYLGPVDLDGLSSFTDQHLKFWYR